jgi:SAM-dependent methyltransferase
MQDNLLNNYCMEMPVLKDRSYKQLRRIIELYASKNPGADVLEIGAGTGGATQTVLEAFGAKGNGSGSLLGHYTFTDVSTRFFEAGREKLHAWQGILSFAKLDIESDPVEQSFVAGGYDLIIASMVLHATKDLQKTMLHVRKLLKPGGQAILVETIQDRLDPQMIFGTLPGWGLGQESYRKMSPNVPLHTWDEVLKASGFTGLDFEISDCEQKDHVNASVIMTTAVVKPSYFSPISIVYVEPLPQTWVTRLSNALRNETGLPPAVETLDHLLDVEDKICIFTAELLAPFIDKLNQASFEKLRHLLVNSRGILWLSAGSMLDASDASYWQTLGLLRTLRLEHANNRYVHLDFEHDVENWSEDTVSTIIHVLRRSFDYNKDHTEIDWEYAAKNSILYVPRVYGEKQVENGVAPAPQLQPFLKKGHTVGCGSHPSRVS